MRRRSVPMLKTICENNEYHSVPGWWGSFYSNVYVDGYGYPRANQYDAQRYQAEDVLYRIKVIRK